MVGHASGNQSIRGPEASRRSVEVVTLHAQAPTPHTRARPSVDTYGQLSQPAIGPEPTYLPNDLRNRRNLARGGYSSRPVPDLRGQARLRPPFTSFCTAGGDELARRGGSDRGGEVAGGPSCSTQPVEGRPVALRKAPAGGDRVWYRPPGTAPQGTRRARAQSNLQRR